MVPAGARKPSPVTDGSLEEVISEKLFTGILEERAQVFYRLTNSLLQRADEDWTRAHFYALISEFERQTGVPVVLNTSFNDNEPIVCRPEEALDCFARTQMDVLVMGNFALEKKSALAASAMSADGFVEPLK